MNSLSKEIDILNNIKFLKDGYGLCSLEAMVPSDVPVVLINGKISIQSINQLKQVQNYGCIVAVGEVTNILLENNLKVDFIIFAEDTDYDCFVENEEWINIPIITNSRIPVQILKKHKGKKFFYSSGNLIEADLFQDTISKCERIFRYNTLVNINVDSIKECMVAIGRFIGSYYTIVIDETENRYVEIYNNKECFERVDIRDKNLNKYFNISVHMEIILSWVIPLFDKRGKEFFENIYNQLLEDFSGLQDTVNNGKELYYNLYDISCRETVTREELNCLVEQLNLVSTSINNYKYINFLLDLSQTVNLEMNLNKANNEIGQVALEGIAICERLYYLLKIFISDVSRCLTSNDEYVYDLSNSEKSHNMLLVAGSSQYNVLPHFVIGLKKGFQEQGYVTYIQLWDNQEECGFCGINHFQQTVGFEYIFLMNGVFLSQLRYDNIAEIYKYFFDNANSKIVSMFVDHPIHHQFRLSLATNNYRVLFPDDNWVKYVRKHMKNIENPCFFPVGGVESELIFFPDWEKRRNVVAFFGSYADLNLLQDRINQHQHRYFINLIIDELKNSPALTIEEAVDRLQKKNGCGYTLNYILHYSDVFEIIDTYIRQYFRQKVIDTIVHAGIPIELYGWNDTIYKDKTNVFFHDAVSFNEMLTISQKVRFVLNVQPWLKMGTQERVFNTMLAGAIAITDSTEYLQHEFIDKENILMYQLYDLQDMTSTIMYYMNHENDAKEIAINGQKLTKEKHTWQDRAGDLIKIL